MLRYGFAAIAAMMAAAPLTTAAAAPADTAGAFNGPFVGIQGGWQQDRLRENSVDALGNFGAGHSNGSGFGYGGQVGYDYRLPSNLVLGVEGAVTGRTGHGAFDNGFGQLTSDRFGRTVDATGRIGLVFGPYGGLGYFRGGYTNTRILLDDGIARNAYNRDGYTVGVGYEQAITRHVSARLEYDYSDYGHANTSATAVDYGDVASSTRLHRNAVTAGLNYHF